MEPATVDMSPLLPHVLPWCMVFIRVLGVMIFMPMVSSGSVPVRLRVFLAAGIAVAVYGWPGIADAAQPPTGLMELGMCLFGELLIGMGIGAIGGIPFIAIEMAGHIMGYQMGLALAQAYNPELDTNLNSLGSMMFYMGIVIFASIGGLEAMFLAVVQTFERVPVGTVDVTMNPAETILRVLTAGTEVALSIAMPVLAVIILLLIVIGFIMKTMPQINVMSVGFAVKIVFGVAMMLISIFTINEVIGAHFEWGIMEAVGWARSLTAAGGN